MRDSSSSAALLFLTVAFAACGESGPTDAPGATTWDLDVDVTYMDLRYCSQGTVPIVYRFTVEAAGETVGVIETPGFPAQSGAWVPGAYQHYRFDGLSTVVTVPNGADAPIEISFEAGEWSSGLLNPQLVGKRDVVLYTTAQGLGSVRRPTLQIGSRTNFGSCTWLHADLLLNSKARP